MKKLYFITDVCAFILGFISIGQLSVGGDRSFWAPLSGVITYFIFRLTFRKI